MAAQNPDKAAVSKTIPEWEAWVADHPPLQIAAPTGEMFEVPAPERWPDAALELASTEPVKAARMLLRDRYDDWTETGANTAYLFARIEAVAGASLGESQASSGS